MKDLKDLWDKPRVAQFLGISVFSVSGKVVRREIPYVKIGRRVLFDPDDLQAFVESCKVTPRR